MRGVFGGGDVRQQINDFMALEFKAAIIPLGVPLSFRE
jgi:hypothetical protein